jgi:hypothetical protein
MVIQVGGFLVWSQQDPTAATNVIVHLSILALGIYFYIWEKQGFE